MSWNRSLLHNYINKLYNSVNLILSSYLLSFLHQLSFHDASISLTDEIHNESIKSYNIY